MTSKMQVDHRTPAFPQEIIDVVADQLDPSAYAIFSFVSRSWLVSVRRHSFHDMYIESSKPGRSLVNFLEMLEASFRSFHCVKRLQVSGITPFRVLVDVLRHLEGLRTLRLQHAVLTQIPEGLDISVLLDRTLDNITLVQVDVTEHDAPWDPKLALVRLFSSITELSIQPGPTYNERFRTSTTQTIKNSSTINHVARSTCIGSTFVIQRTGYESSTSCAAFAALALQSLDLSHVTTFSMPLWPAACGREYVQLLYVVSNSLTRLTLDMRDFRDSDAHDVSSEFWQDLKLSHCPSLTDIRFAFYSSNRNIKMWRLVLDALSTLPRSTSLDSIVLQTSFKVNTLRDGEPLLPLLPWSRLKDVLLSFRRVETLAFSVQEWREAGYVGIAREGIAGALRGLGSKCALEFYEFGTDWGLE